MKKLTLNVEELDVLSFDTIPSEPEQGTVQGFAWSDDSVCPTVTDGGGRCRPY